MDTNDELLRAYDTVAAVLLRLDKIVTVAWPYPQDTQDLLKARALLDRVRAPNCRITKNQNLSWR